MADIKPPEERSRNMAAIHGKDTKPELYLRKLLFSQGYRYRLYDTRFPGHPDLYLAKYNMAKDRDKSYPEEEHHGTGIRAVITW